MSLFEQDATAVANPHTSTWPEAHAVILIGHGSLRSASGASMIRIAARLRADGVAPWVEPAFLNFSRPTLADALARCRAAGAQAVTIQPYFLIEGAYVRHDLPRLIAETLAAEAAQGNPPLPVRVAPALGDHPAMVELARMRIAAALAQNGRNDAHTGWGLALMAHGTPLVEANAPLYRILDQLQTGLDIDHGVVAFLDCNTPTIPDGIRTLIERGVNRVVTLPYFLHMGRHVREDLPQLVAEAAATWPHVEIVAAGHLDYDLRLVQAITHRLQEAAANQLTPSPTTATRPEPASEKAEHA